MTQQDQNAGIRILSRRTLSDDFFRLEKVTFEQQGRDGAPQTLDREVYHNNSGAAVLPFDPACGTVLLIRQFRLPALLSGGDARLIEVCAGIVDGDDHPSTTVAKEARQEMGYRLHAIRQSMELYISPGSCTERLHLFHAEYGAGDRIGSSGGLAEEGENIDLLELPLSDALAMIADGRIRDAKTVLLLQQRRLEQLGLDRIPDGRPTADTGGHPPFPS